MKVVVNVIIEYGEPIPIYYNESLQ